MKWRIGKLSRRVQTEFLLAWAMYVVGASCIGWAANTDHWVIRFLLRWLAGYLLLYATVSAVNAQLRRSLERKKR